MAERIAGFTGEYLWELDICEHHLRALADAIPADRYDWRPAEDARSISEVLVHVASGNLALLDMMGVEAPLAFYAPLEAQGQQRFFATIAKIHDLEKRVTAKADVVEMLGAALVAVRGAFSQLTGGELETTGEFFGEQTTVRRVYLRILAHTHEHMGQLVAYVRAIGIKAPWPDPMDEVKRALAWPQR